MTANNHKSVSSMSRYILAKFMAGTIFTWVTLNTFLFIARSSFITATVSLSVAVLRLVLSTSEGLPDRWFRPAIDAAGDAFSQVYPGVLFNFQEYYPLSAPCWNASGAFLQSNLYMKVFNYAMGQGTYLPVNAILGPYCSAKVSLSVIHASQNIQYPVAFYYGVFLCKNS